MSINPYNSKKILVVHGINPGDESDIIGHTRLQKALHEHLVDNHIDHTVDIVKYESINDIANTPLSLINNMFVKSLLAEAVIAYTVDLVGDVFVYVRNSDPARQIRDRIKTAIMDNYYHKHDPLTIVAHSLGSLYAFDVMNELLIDHPELFDANDRKTWPVQALITLGSPIGLVFFNDRQLVPFDVGQSQMRWYNMFDREDPVVTGNIFGQKTHMCEIAEQYQTPGWEIKDIAVDNGSSWIKAHTNYWENPYVLDTIVSVITS